MPKIGPFKAVNFKIPTQQTEDMYIKSVNATVDELHHTFAAGQGRQDFDLPNRDFDTGRETRPGEYQLTDKTYATLVDKLASKTSEPLDPGPAGRFAALLFRPECA